MILIKKNLLVIMGLIILGAGMLFSGCGKEEEAGDIFSYLEQERESRNAGKEYDPVIINLVHSSPETSAVSRVAHMFKSLVEDRSKGQILVEIYPGDSLGYIYDYGTAMKEGTVDAWIGSGSARLNNVIYWLPTLMDVELEDIQSFVQSDVYLDRLQGECEDDGYFALGVFPVQYRVVTANKKITSVEDLSDLHMRSFLRFSLDGVFWESLGAEVSHYDIHELYGALENGLVDSQSNSLPVTVSNRLYEQQMYRIDLQHMTYFDGLFMGTAFYESLRDELKAVIDLVADEIRAYAQDMYQAEYGRCELVMEKAGVQILPIDDVFRDEVKKIAKPDLEVALRNSVGDDEVDFVLDGMKKFVKLSGGRHVPVEYETPDESAAPSKEETPGESTSPSREEKPRESAAPSKEDKPDKEQIG